MREARLSPVSLVPSRTVGHGRRHPHVAVFAWAAFILAGLLGCRGDAHSVGALPTSGPTPVATPVATVVAAPAVPAATFTPTPVTPSPTRTPPPTRGIAEPHGLFLAHKDGDLWLLALDHSRPDQLIARADGSRIQYDGSVRVGDETWIYHTRLDLQQDYSGTAVVQRTTVGSGLTEGVAEFDLTARFNGWAARISPDGSTLAYVDIDGLHIRALPDGSERVLSPNDSTGCRRPDFAISRCYSNLAPRWSPGEVVPGLVEL